MSVVQKLLDRLDGVEGKGPQWRAICPAHQSRHRTRSLAIKEGDRGQVLVRCHAGCEVAEILGALGMELSDLFPPRLPHDQHFHRGEKRPWPLRDVLSAFVMNERVIWVVLNDYLHDRPLDESGKQLVRKLMERQAAMLGELTS